MMEPLFKADEMNLKAVDQAWRLDEVLQEQAVFYLKDLVKLLRLNVGKIKQHVAELERQGLNPWEEMGVRKMWTHWLVRMSRFAPYYRAHLMPKVKEINPKWSSQELLCQEGIFWLSDVCKLMPFSAHQLRYRVKNHPNPRQEYGIWKEDARNVFMVDMPLFSAWIKTLWNEAPN